MSENTSPTPNKPKNRFASVVNWVICVLFTVLICLPMVLLITTGEDKTVLDGEKQYTAPSFAASDFVSSEFQSDFELWFSTKYPMRGNFVTAYRQLQFDTSNIGFDISMLFVPKTPAPAETEPAETDAPAVDAVDTLESTEETEVIEEPTSPYSDFNPLYTEMNRRLYEREAVESSGYKGTDQVIIGKSGYCYENGYINELLGYSSKYRDCPDSWIEDRVEKLTYIQDRLAEMGIAFTLIITPSKAADYARFIPEWYKAQNTEPENYVRPVTKLLEALSESTVNYINCQDVFDEAGLDETFPLTGTHWNKPAAYEATRALLHAYEEQQGVTVRNILAESIREQKQPSNFGNPETDIFGIAYSGLSTKKAIMDDYYYIPEIVEENEDGKRISVLIQGGSFCWDFKYYMQGYKITRLFNQFYYNTWQGKATGDPRKAGDDAWAEALKGINYVIFETNEQYVCQMGTDSPSWGAADKQAVNTNSWDVYESLYNYLKSTETAD